MIRFRMPVSRGCSTSKPSMIRCRLSITGRGHPLRQDADGWASLRGQAPPRPPLLALSLDTDAARRLHHVLRPGTTVLVRSPAATD